MKVCYVILTCEAYQPTRCQLIRDTWLKRIGSADAWFLSARANPEARVLGWNTLDTYDSCPIKYQQFFLNLPGSYDWYVFCDDDTYLFPERLEPLLGDPSRPQCIGMLARKPDLPPYMAGGPGFLLSSAAVAYLPEACRTIPIQSLYSDVMIGIWLKDTPTEFIDNPLFFNYPHDHPLGGGDPRTACGYHYVDAAHVALYSHLHSGDTPEACTTSVRTP
jgi:hypothetical protein